VLWGRNERRGGNRKRSTIRTVFQTSQIGEGEKRVGGKSNVSWRVGRGYVRDLKDMDSGERVLRAGWWGRFGGSKVLAAGK